MENYPEVFFKKGYLHAGEISVRQQLALDALSKLAKQFSHQPDLYKIIEVFVLTILGQFTVANAFVLFIKSNLPGKQKFYYATGSFKGNNLLSTLDLAPRQSSYFLENRHPQRVEEINLEGRPANLKFILSESNVKLLTPLIHNNELIGLVGIGPKVTAKPFDNSDIEILSTIINTITPFVANTFLFIEMTELGKWYLEILDNVKQGVCVFDNKGLLKKINKAGYGILRTFRPMLYSIESLYHVPIELIFPDAVYPNWAAMFKGEKKSDYEKLHKNLRAGNQTVKKLFNVRISTIIDQSTDGTDMIITLDDITEQKENEQRLFNLEKLADKGAMVASITHELNNLLAMTLAGVEIAQRAIIGGDTDKAKTTLEKVNGAVQQMERFTAGLTDYTKIETTKNMASLNKIIHDVLSFVSAQNKFRGLDIIIEVDPMVPEFEMDVNQIAQVLLNFLNNAADSIIESGREAGKISLKTVYENSVVKLVISDNGKGIEPELKEKMFKTHFTTKPGGHGYGLVTCGRILKNHNCDVEIESEPDKGTSFILSFKLSPETNNSTIP